MENVNAIQEFVNLVKGVGPDVWAIMIKQQLIYAYMGIGFLVTSIIAAVVGFIGMMKERNRDKPSSGIFFQIICVGCFCLIIALITFFGDSLPRLISPEYFAIMDLKP